jgi:hypothetical protein
MTEPTRGPATPEPDAAAGSPPAGEPEALAAEAAEEVAAGREGSGADRRRSSVRAAWLVLLLLLGAGVLIGPMVEGGPTLLANPDATAADAVRAAFSRLPQPSLVLVAMDADLGTYPEIRATTRVALADLLGRGASLAFVSVSVEGRAIAAAELERIRRSGVSSDRLLDLGFVAGAEAGMVRLVDGALRPGMTGPIAARLAQGGGGIGAVDLIVVVGGTDIGPRSWVEQVGTRLPLVPMVAVAPTFAQPELAPYVRTGQLDGLLATIRDDAAYAQGVSSAGTGDALPSTFALRIGMVVALIVLLRQLAGAVPRLGGGSLAGGTLDQ